MTTGVPRRDHTGKQGLLFLLTIVGVVASAGTGTVAVLLLAIAASAWGLVAIPRFRPVRPPQTVVRVACIGGAAGAAVWLLSNLVSVQYTASPCDAYILRGGTFRIEHYSARMARFSNRPRLTLEWEPGFLPGGLVSCIELGNYAAGSSRILNVPIWGFVLVIVCSALLLRDLRRRRAPLNRCATCEYDLSGNVSGTCPECGTQIPGFKEQESNGGMSARRP